MQMSEKTFIERLAKMPRSLAKIPWLGILWDGSNMLISEKNRKLAEELILWMVDCDPDERKYKSALFKVSPRRSFKQACGSVPIA